MTDKDKLVGAWRLISTRFRSEDGSLGESPYGTDSKGLLMYDAQGHMSAQIGQTNRAPFATADRKAGSDQQTRAAFESYQAYCGNYIVDEREQVVTHTVTLSLLPNWVGTEQRRHYEFSDGKLILRTPPMTIGGKSLNGELVWEKIESVK